MPSDTFFLKILMANCKEPSRRSAVERKFKKNQGLAESETLRSFVLVFEFVLFLICFNMFLY